VPPPREILAVLGFCTGNTTDKGSTSQVLSSKMMPTSYGKISKHANNKLSTAAAAKDPKWHRCS
jgi:hypothetical protein